MRCYVSSRLAAVATVSLIAASALLAQDPADQAPSTSTNATENPNPSVGAYAKRTVGIRGVAMAAAGAGVTQGTNTPAEWGQGAAGFARRFASSFGKHIVSNVIRYPVSRMFHEEIMYHRSGEHGFFRRTRYALLSTVITHKTTTGDRTLFKGELAGAVGSGLISRLWQPASTRTIALGFSSAGTSLAVDAGIRVLREFWPDIRHPNAHSALPQPAVPAAALLPAFQLEPDSEPATETEQVAAVEADTQ
ncbi:MAG TPA: hypothetical protein VIY49_14600 [Bryobacteraceae bacterium]